MRKALRIGMLVSLFACDPNVELESIKPDNLVSVTCFISPQDTVFTAYVFKASAIGSTVKTDSAAVKDAQVTISDGLNYDTLYLTSEFDPDAKITKYKYLGKPKHISVTANSTYTLDVKVRQVVHLSATCTIPPAAESVKIEGNRLNDDYPFSTEWNNPTRHKYFLLILEAQGNYPNPYPGGGGTIDLKPELIDDIKFPSDKQVIQNKYNGIMAYTYRADNPLLKVSVKNIDEDTYKYFKTYQQYATWDLNNSGNIFPNFKDVPLIHSNINGGVGIFGGYNTISVTIQIK